MEFTFKHKHLELQVAPWYHVQRYLEEKGVYLPRYLEEALRKSEEDETKTEVPKEVEVRYVIDQIYENCHNLDEEQRERGLSTSSSETRVSPSTSHSDDSGIGPSREVSPQAPLTPDNCPSTGPVV